MKGLYLEVEKCKIKIKGFVWFKMEAKKFSYTNEVICVFFVCFVHNIKR